MLWSVCAPLFSTCSARRRRFGTVSAATHRRSGTPCVVKVILKQDAGPSYRTHLIEAGVARKSPIC